MEAEPTPVIAGKDLLEVFKSFDKDNSGTIELSELKAVIKEMGETIPEKELLKIMKNMDTNGDGKISFPEFEYWWKYGQKGKLKNIVGLKYKAMKLIHQANAKLTKSDIKLKVTHALSQDTYTNEISTFEINVSLGDANANIEVGLEMALMGQLYKSTVDLLKQQVPSLDQNKLSVLFSFETKNAAEGKKKIDEMMEAYKKEAETSENSLFHELIRIFHIESVVTNNTLSVVLTPGKNDNPVEAPLQNVTQVVQSMGKEFSLKLSGAVKLRGSITEAFKTMKFVKWIAQGFSANFKFETNQGFVKNLRRMLEDGAATEQRGFIMILLMTLLNVAKLNLKFRSPENIDEFFESLGIGQLSEQSPNFGELLEEICEELNLADWKEPSNPRHPVFTVLKFLMENVEEYMRIDLVLPFMVLRTQFKCIGGSYLFNTAFKSTPAPSVSK